MSVRKSGGGGGGHHHHHHHRTSRSSSSSISRGGHPMASGSFMINTARRDSRSKPIVITHTNFDPAPETADKPPVGRSNSRTSKSRSSGKPSSRTSGRTRARTSSRSSISSGGGGRGGLDHQRSSISTTSNRPNRTLATCSLCVATLCSFIGVSLVVAGVFVLIDGQGGDARTITACILLVVGVVFIVVAGFGWGCLYRLYVRANHRDHVARGRSTKPTHSTTKASSGSYSPAISTTSSTQNETQLSRVPSRGSQLGTPSTPNSIGNPKYENTSLSRESSRGSQRGTFSTPDSTRASKGETSTHNLSREASKSSQRKASQSESYVASVVDDQLKSRHWYTTDSPVDEGSYQPCFMPVDSP